ncbi:hypothetical protein [Hahella sp. HN01]|uniref:hypothetical protein n=1 Tax=Hahella sp. HN01 TaxID=2847262 RepID=UPI001C1EE8C8|nr:hypothetical protein [Hahella sp. HN01]MBU6952577.1 hypothetical protein [Hahella sp. HN01]
MKKTQLLVWGAVIGGLCAVTYQFMPGGESASTTQEQQAAAGAQNSAAASPAQSVQSPQQTASKSTPGAAKDSEPELPDYAMNNEEYPSIEFRMTEIEARRDGRAFDQEEVVRAMWEPSAWKSDDGIADQLELSDADRFDGREFIRFSPMKLESLMPGDEMEVPVLPQNATYQMVVDRVESHGDGNVTWYGHLKDFEQDNQVSFTRGENLTYGGVTTPEGLYVVEARGDKGWIVNSGTLFKGEDLHVEVPELADVNKADEGTASPDQSTGGPIAQ